MIKQRVAKAKTGLCVAVLVLIAIMVPAMAGCGSSTPEAAVSDYYQAITDHNFNAYLNSILPENVRRMTSSDMQSAKKSFKESEIKYNDLKFKTTMNKKDENKAEVQMIAGTVSFRNPSTGEKKSMTVEEIKRTYNVNATDAAVKYKGSWYVDVPMASADATTTQ